MNILCGTNSESVTPTKIIKDRNRNLTVSMQLET